MSKKSPDLVTLILDLFFYFFGLFNQHQKAVKMIHLVCVSVIRTYDHLIISLLLTTKPGPLLNNLIVFFFKSLIFCSVRSSVSH